MAEVVAAAKTSHGYEDVIVSAINFFVERNWRLSEQSARTAAFVGRPAIPWRVQLLLGAGLLALIVPGVVYYLLSVRKSYGFAKVVVSATPIHGGTEVAVRHPAPAAPIAQQFVGTLPPLEARVPLARAELSAAGPA
jgi:hypothetical protein